MSRKKNSAVKQMRGANPMRKLKLTIHGSVWLDCPEACELAGDIDWLFKMLPHVKRTDRKIFSNKLTDFGMASKAVINRLLGNLQAAIEKKDGGFFRYLAEAIEQQGNGAVEKRKSILVGMLQGFKAGQPQKRIITLAAIQKVLAHHNIQTSRRQLIRDLDDLGLTYSEGKRGQPAKKKNSDNSSD